jgi:hypothetical protein
MTGTKATEFLNPASQRAVARIGIFAGALAMLLGLMCVFTSDWSNSLFMSFCGIWCLADSIAKLRRNREQDSRSL